MHGEAVPRLSEHCISGAPALLDFQEIQRATPRRAMHIGVGVTCYMCSTCLFVRPPRFAAGDRVVQFVAAWHPAAGPRGTAIAA
jgi:hypothetical protein